jgi:hypothetical protein
MLISKLILTFIGLAAGSTGVALAWQLRTRSLLQAESDRSSSTAKREIHSLEQQVAAQTKRLAVAEARLSTLLNAAKTANATRATEAMTQSPDSPVDASEVARLAAEKGRSLIKEGKSQDALDLYVKTYRELQSFRPGSSACQHLMSSLQHLSRTFPPALAALAQLRDDAMAQLHVQPGRRDVLNFEIALLNERLGQGERTLALFDALSPGDIQRGSLAMVARDAFIKARRYQDALLGKSIGQMIGAIDSSVRLLATETDASRQAMIRKAIVDQTLPNSEVLAGAGKTEESRQLTEKLLAFDSSETTRVRLEQHLARARGASQ